jgi:hypothetical protein
LLTWVPIHPSGSQHVANGVSLTRATPHLPRTPYHNAHLPPPTPHLPPLPCTLLRHRPHPLESCPRGRCLPGGATRDAELWRVVDEAEPGRPPAQGPAHSPLRTKTASSIVAAREKQPAAAASAAIYGAGWGSRCTATARGGCSMPGAAAWVASRGSGSGPGHSRRSLCSRLPTSAGGAGRSRRSSCLCRHGSGAL